MKRLLTALLLAAPMFVSATPIMLTGTFSGTDTTTTSSVGTISGSWSLTYDDTAIAGAGVEFLTVALTGVSLSPNPLGGTTFDLTNTSARLVFNAGALQTINVGGTINTAQGIGFGTDDFVATYEVGTSLSLLAWILASESPVSADANEFDGSWQRVSTPPPNVSEPGMLGLLALGLLAMASRGRRFSSRKLVRAEA